MISELIQKNRSYRRFNPKVKIARQQVENWIDLARCSPSAKNVQPLKYVISTEEDINQQIFPNLAWAGYLKNWKGPSEEERPVAYVGVLHDKSLAEGHYCDDGIAMQSILLGAAEDGFGGCIIGSVNKSRVSRIFNLPDHLELLWIIALGKPEEEVVLETVENDKIEYWRDEKGVHHVPKRRLEDIIFQPRDDHAGL